MDKTDISFAAPPRHHLRPAVPAVPAATLVRPAGAGGQGLQRRLRRGRRAAARGGPPHRRRTGAVRFFFRAVSRINAGFPRLLGRRDEAGEGEGTEEDGGGAGGGSFTDKWGWLANVDRASETQRCPWDAVWVMPALQFLNVLAYRKDKDEWEAEAMERWKRSH